MHQPRNEDAKKNEQWNVDSQVTHLISYELVNQIMQISKKKVKKNLRWAEFNPATTAFGRNDREKYMSTKKTYAQNLMNEWKKAQDVKKKKLREKNV